MKTPENTASWQQLIYCAAIECMGFFQDAAYQDPAYFYNYSTKKYLHFLLIDSDIMSGVYKIG